jgi:hypothetical protein
MVLTGHGLSSSSQRKAGMRRRVDREVLFRYGAPVLLCAVALLQQYGAHRHALSPWKGGGFGMFSTVDSPSARFLRIHLSTSGGEIAVLPPRRLSEQVRQVRAMPTRSRLAPLAEELGRSAWRVYLWNPLGESSAAGAGGLARRDPARKQAVEIPLYRALDEDEGALPAGGETVAFERVRVEVWQYRFDAERVRIEARKLRELSVPRIARIAAGGAKERR